MTRRLMKTPKRFELSRLSLKRYLDFIKQAQFRQFTFVRFSDFLPGKPAPSSPYIVLRHDIDFAPQYSVEMAELEQDQGVVSTFFVLLDGQFYNPLETERVRQLRRIQALGHEIGLHFAVSSRVEDDLGKEIAFRLRVLSEIVAEPVVSFSQHDPVNAGFAKVSLPRNHYACVDASKVIKANDLLYVSDSAMMWRRHTFHTALDQSRNLCLLAHPHSWLHPQDDYIAMIREIEVTEVKAINARYDRFVDALNGYYQRRLNEGV